MIHLHYSALVGRRYIQYQVIQSSLFIPDRWRSLLSFERVTNHHPKKGHQELPGCVFVDYWTLGKSNCQWTSVVGRFDSKKWWQSGESLSGLHWQVSWHPFEEALFAYMFLFFLLLKATITSEFHERHFETLYSTTGPYVFLGFRNRSLMYSDFGGSFWINMCVNTKLMRIPMEQKWNQNRLSEAEANEHNLKKHTHRPLQINMNLKITQIDKEDHLNQTFFFWGGSKCEFSLVFILHFRHSTHERKTIPAACFVSHKTGGETCVNSQAISNALLKYHAPGGTVFFSISSHENLGSTCFQQK